MQIWMLLLGGVLLSVVIVDALVTTIAPGSGGGPVTTPLSRGLWRLLRRLSRDPRGPLLSASGPLAVGLIVMTWLLGLWLGWTLVFASDTSAVVSSSGELPADLWSRVYFAGYTIFTLGLGDFVPAGSPWQIATVLAAGSGLFLTTLAITYILPVMTAATERRQQAARIAGLGHDAQEIVVNAWDGVGFDFLEQVLPDLAAELVLTAERQLTYPILSQFHAGSITEDHHVQLVALDEAITLLEHAVDHDRVDIHPLLLRLVRHATTQHLDRAEVSSPDDDTDAPPTLDLTPLREAGIPTVDDAAFDRAVADDLEHRQHLVALAHATPWDRSIVVQARHRDEGD